MAQARPPADSPPGNVHWISVGLSKSQGAQKYIAERTAPGRLSAHLALNFSGFSDASNQQP